MFGDILDGFTDAFDSVDSWFDGAIKNIDAGDVLTGAGRVMDVMQKRDAADAQYQGSLLSKISSTTSDKRNRAAGKDAAPSAGKVKYDGSEDFYAWERRWMSRMREFYNVSATEVRVNK